MECWDRKRWQTCGGEVEDNSLCAVKWGRTEVWLLSLLLGKRWSRPSNNRNSNKHKCNWTFFLWKNWPLCELLWIPVLHSRPGWRAVTEEWRPTMDWTCSSVLSSHLGLWLIFLVGCGGGSTMRLHDSILNCSFTFLHLWPENFSFDNFGQTHEVT